MDFPINRVCIPNKKSLLTFMSSSVQNLFLSRILAGNNKDVTPPVKSTMPSLCPNYKLKIIVAASALPIESAYHNTVITMGFGIGFL